MAEHPYKNQPDYAFWRRAVASLPVQQVDPVVSVPFSVSRSDRVATAGSCFAQHIARYLRENGFNFFVTETPHPIVPEDLAAAYGYGMFSARYGNIYTARQLLQLFKRAYGTFQPEEDCWHDEQGNLIDPFRPQIQPGGFCHASEYEADRRRHMECVRRVFEECDVFIFTLGLTECWVSRSDGSAYPLCPGVAGGSFNEARYAFVNFSVDDIAGDLKEFMALLKGVNRKVRVVLTVSPVPLIATAEDRHVLVSTTYSKAVLRVAAELTARDCSEVAYFPSYEIVAGHYNRGIYFETDCRSVTEAGVSHVMRLFLKHYGGESSLNAPVAAAACRTEASGDAHVCEMEHLVGVMCDEEALDR